MSILSTHFEVMDSWMGSINNAPTLKGTHQSNSQELQDNSKRWSEQTPASEACIFLFMSDTQGAVFGMYCARHKGSQRGFGLLV